MKILFVSEQYTPTVGGAVVAAQQLICGLVQRGQHVAVLTISPHFLGKFWGKTDETGATIYRAMSIPGLVNPKVNYNTVFPLLTATYAILKERPDCIHMLTPFGPTHLITLFWARLLKIPIVTTNHVMPENAVMTFRHWPLKNLAKQISGIAWRNIMLCANVADYVTAPTPTALAMLHEHGLEQPAMAISNGIDADYYAPGQPDQATIGRLGLVAARGPKLIYVGRLDEEKRLDIIVAALPPIIKKIPDAHLILVGTGVRSDALKLQAEQLGVQDHITFTGRITDDEKRDLLRFADVFVIASPAELQCIAGLEALACGLPIVAANVAALTEMCQDGSNGYLFTYPDARDLAAKAAQLLASPDTRKQFGASSRAWIVHNHSLDMVIEQYVIVYKSVVGAIEIA